MKGGPGAPEVVAVEAPRRDLANEVINVSGKPITVREYVQDVRLHSEKKETAVSRVRHELKVSEAEARAVIEEAWNSTPREKLVTSGITNGIVMTISVLIVGGFVIVIGIAIVGLTVKGLGWLASGKVVTAALTILFAFGLFLYAKWAFNGKS